MSSSDVRALHAACDQLVASAADPDAARALLLRVWALGAAAADDLLADLGDVAARQAARTGSEATAAELLDALGRHQGASLVRDGVERGLADHRAAAEALAAAAVRADAARRAARAAVRIAQVTHHRTRAA